MLPLSRAIYFWRRARSFTQAKLARRTGISRPNLSAIERGSRDITVGTLRQFAQALQVRPGILVDGIPPGERASKRLTRGSMERIAEFVIKSGSASERPQLPPREREIAGLLVPLVSRKLRLQGFGVGRISRNRNFGVKEFELLKSKVSAAEFGSLLNRIDKKLQGRYEPQRN
jgi:transcriptional regulator with XRE-family HTH domain